MRLPKTLLAFAFLCMSGSLADAQFQFHQIRQACIGFEDQNSAATFSQGLCAGLIEGVIYASPNVCMPAQANLAQAAKIVLNYANRIPERWHEHRARIVEEALKLAWPCR